MEEVCRSCQQFLILEPPTRKRSFRLEVLRNAWNDLGTENFSCFRSFPNKAYFYVARQGTCPVYVHVYKEEPLRFVTTCYNCNKNVPLDPDLQQAIETNIHEVPS